MTVSPISDAEAHVMDVLWRQRSAGPLSADEIAQALSPQREWKPSTVKTMAKVVSPKAKGSTAISPATAA